MAGIDARAGKPLGGWGHVLQSLDEIFSQRFGERAMREWFGSFVPRLLGELAVQSSVLRFYTAVYVAIELWEPRLAFRGVRFLSTTDEVRAGIGRYDIDVDYLPRGHLGDTTPAGRRTIAAEAAGAGLTVGGM